MTLTCGALGQSSDVPSALKNFSEFQQVDLSKLLAGDILAERGELMTFPNGISTQTCFVVPTSPEETARLLPSWDPSPHEELKVSAFVPVSPSVTAEDFKRLDLKSGQKPIRWFIDKTLATTADKSDFNLSRTEAQELMDCVKKNSDPAVISSCWINLLLARVTAFQNKGLDGAAPYDLAKGNIAPDNQVRALLRDRLPITREFSSLLEKSGLLRKGIAAQLKPLHYWTLFEADHHSTVTLGAVYVLPIGDHYQVADVSYYVSSGYYTLLTLYEIWPIRDGNKLKSLVWRGDLIAAPMLAHTKGVDRMAYGVIMLQEVKKSIRSFQEDLKAK